MFVCTVNSCVELSNLNILYAHLSNTDTLVFGPDISLTVLETTALPCLSSPSRTHDLLNVPMSEEGGGLCGEVNQSTMVITYTVVKCMKASFLIL